MVLHISVGTFIACSMPGQKIVSLSDGGGWGRDEVNLLLLEGGPVLMCMRA